jgi:hypothetical protein
MRKRLLFLVAILLVVATAGGIYVWQTSLKSTLQERAVSRLVRSFGRRLDNVSLLADREIATASIAANYRAFISQKLLADWQADPSKAPGRLTSSPWPDRIEIEYLDKLTPKRYMVTGKIIEVTSAEAEGGVAARQPIVISVEKIEGVWRITHVVLGAYESR